MNEMSGIAPRPGIAIISNSYTPYRLHLHRRIVEEIPEVKLWSLFTHETSNAPWHFDPSAEARIGAVQFGRGESSALQSSLRFSIREWVRAGNIIKWIIEHDIRFVLMMGYNDLGRIRIIRWCHRAGLPCWLFGDNNILGDSSCGVKALIKRRAVATIVAWCSGIFCCGSLGRKYFVKYGAAPEDCVFFPYEPDYAAIQNMSNTSISLVTEHYKLRKDRRRLVFSGRLIGIKRADLAIAAFSAIAERRPEWDLLIIGDGPLRSSLEANVPASLADRVIWTGFLDDQSTISALYRASDVLVLPSDKEPWALVINEAVAAGLAVVCSNVVGAAAELVSDGVNGRIFSAGNLAAFVICLLDVTDAARICEMKACSPPLLARWRRIADPVEGLRRVLQKSCVLYS